MGGWGSTRWGDVPPKPRTDSVWDLRVTDVLRVAPVRATGETNQVDEQNRDDLALLPGFAYELGATRGAEAGPAGILLATPVAAHWRQSSAGCVKARLIAGRRSAAG